LYADPVKTYQTLQSNLFDTDCYNRFLVILLTKKNIPIMNENKICSILIHRINEL